MKEQVKQSVFYAHPPEKVWQALTNRRVLNVWMMNNNFEPRLGHKFKFESNSLPGIKTVIYCQVVELEKPKRLAYTWQDNITGASLVIWTLTPVEGGTQLQLKHQLTGYATTLIGDRSRDFRDCPGLFLSQQLIPNCDRQIPETISLQQMAKDELNFLLNCRSSKEEWDYLLNHKLPQTLRR